VKITDAQYLSGTLFLEGFLILLLFIHLVYFFKKYKSFIVTCSFLLVIIVVIGVQFSDWNYKISAPLIKKNTFIGFWVFLAGFPYFALLIRRILRPLHIKKILARKGPLKEVMIASEALAQEKIGALLILANRDSLSHFTEQGLLIDSHLKRELLISLLAPNTPTHEGAIIIKGDRISACSVGLPISKKAIIDSSVEKKFQIALDFSQHYDSLVIYISEASGQIHFLFAGKVYSYVSMKQSKKLIKQLLS